MTDDRQSLTSVEEEARAALMKAGYAVTPKRLAVVAQALTAARLRGMEEAAGIAEQIGEDDGPLSNGHDGTCRFIAAAIREASRGTR